MIFTVSICRDTACKGGMNNKIIGLLDPRGCFPLGDYRLHIAGHHSVINPLRLLSLSPARTPRWSNMFPLIRSRTYIVACGHLLKARQKLHCNLNRMQTLYLIKIIFYAAL